MKKKSRKRSQSRTIVFSLLTALVVFFAGFFWIQYVRNNSISTTRFPMTIIALKETGKKYTITGEYPLFSDELKALNSAVEKTVKDSVNEFVKTASTNWDERMKMAQSEEEKPKEPFQFFLTWTPDQLNSRFISIILRLDEYVGGANMVDNVFTFNYDVTKRAFVTLQDLYPNEKDVLMLVSTYAKEDLVGQHRDEIVRGEFPKDMIDEGTKATEENFSRFTFTDTVITLYFPKYQVAPGVYGEQKVLVPRALTSGK